MSDLSNEAIELALRDYASAILEGHERIMATLADLKANHEELKTAIISLHTEMNTRFAEREADHAATLNQASAMQIELRTAVKNAADAIASDRNATVPASP